MPPIDKRHHSTIISRVKVMAELDIAEKRVPQDGRFKLRLPGKTIDFRVSIMPSVHGEDAVIRILDKESISEQFRELRLDILGFPEDELRRFRKYIAEPYGMVLVTGPTGSGKTTTLYAALSEIKSIEDKIITIEDPVEYQLRGITQIPINEKKGLTFARGLRSILRHDPDKIMVGEIRDPETAQIAIQSALTGHLVFTTVHANNVLDVLGRFLNMGVEPYQFVSALNCVLAQRLVRNICLHCKRPATVTRAQLEESALDPALEHSGQFFEGVGCIECGGTGFKGRTAICELLDLSDSIRELILARRPTSEIKKAAREEGMRFLRESAVERVMLGADDTARDQQGDVRRMSAHIQPGSVRRASWIASPPPSVAVEISSKHVAAVAVAAQGGGSGHCGLRRRAAAGRCGRASVERRQRPRSGGARRRCPRRAGQAVGAAAAHRAGPARHRREGVAGPLRQGPAEGAGPRSADPLAGAEGGALPDRGRAAVLGAGHDAGRWRPRVRRHRRAP